MGPLSHLEACLSRSTPTAIGEFFHCWTPDAIILLGRTSRILYYIVQWVVRRRWSVESFLSQWFISPSSFRVLLRDHRGFITGTQSLNFFHGIRDYAEPLDIFVRLDGVRSMGQYISENGYHFLPNPSAENIAFDEAVTRRVLQTSPSAGIFDSYESFVFASIYSCGLGDIQLRAIHIHVPRCDPARHVLGYQSSTSQFTLDPN